MDLDYFNVTSLAVPPSLQPNEESEPEEAWLVLLTGVAAPSEAALALLLTWRPFLKPWLLLVAVKMLNREASCGETRPVQRRRGGWGG